MGLNMNHVDSLGLCSGCFGENTTFLPITFKCCDQIIRERYKRCIKWEKLYTLCQESVFCYSLEQLQGELNIWFG